MSVLRRVANMALGAIERGIVRLIDDGEHTQFVQVEGLDDAPAEGVEHHQPYGFTSHPLPGSTALVLSVGGNSGHPVAINAFLPDKRPKGLAEGEVGLYDHEGRLLLVVKAGEQPLVLLGDPNATEAALLGDVAVTLYDAHVHPTPFGPSGAPVASLEPAKSEKVKLA